MSGKLCEYGKTGSCTLRYNGITQCGIKDIICPLDVVKRRGMILHTFIEERKVGNDGIMDLERILNDARKDVLKEIGKFEFKQPYDYTLPQLKVKYEEAATKLCLVVSKLLKWFGSGNKATAEIEAAKCSKFKIVDISKVRRLLPEKENKEYWCYFGGTISDDGGNVEAMLRPDQTFKFQIRGYPELKRYYFKSVSDAQKILAWHQSL